MNGLLTDSLECPLLCVPAQPGSSPGLEIHSQGMLAAYMCEASGPLSFPTLVKLE